MIQEDYDSIYDSRFKKQGVKIWNSISQDLKMLPFNQFKIKH